MTTRAQLRKTAVTFEEVEEATVDGSLTYTVRGKEFVSLGKDRIVRVQLPDAECETAIARNPRLEPMIESGNRIGVQAPIADVDGQHLWHLVMSAWKHRAPRELADKLNQIVASPSQPGSDLPASIGKPATRALAVAGITTLSDVSKRSSDEILELHGVGPKAVRILEESLAEKGMSFNEVE